MHIYVDIGIAAILVIALIIGIVRGFVKQFTGGFCWLIGLIGSIGLTLIIVPALVDSGLLNKLASIAAGWFKSEEFIAPISSYEELTSTLASSNFLKILTSENISARIWSTMSQMQMTTLGAYFGFICTRLISGFAIWIVILLLIKLIFWAIRKGLIKLSTLPVLRTLDKIFGGVWALLLGYVVIVVFVITAAEVIIVKWTPADFQETFREIVDKSTIFNVLHDTNIIGTYIARMFNVDLATLAPIV